MGQRSLSPTHKVFWLAHPLFQQDLAWHDVVGFKFYAGLWSYLTSICAFFSRYIFGLVCLQWKYEIACFIHLYRKYMFFCINDCKFLQDFNFSQPYARLCCISCFYLMSRRQGARDSRIVRKEEARDTYHKPWHKTLNVGNIILILLMR